MVIAFVRTIILYLLIIAGIRLMGKRQVGELEPSELVLALLIHLAERHCELNTAVYQHDRSDCTTQSQKH